MPKSYKALAAALALLILFQYTSFTSYANDPKKILYLNSYHSGYKWSDDILDGIKASLMTYEQEVDLQIEYMDTQRVTHEKYLGELKAIYDMKYKDVKFDVIISSDDAAFKFLMESGNELFPDTPIVFCGVNYFESSMIRNNDLCTGVVEGYDIAETISTALRLHPGTKNIYYLNDDTITGKAIMKEFETVMPQFKKAVNFIRLDGSNLDEIQEKASRLPEDSLVLLLIYFQDRANNYFAYNECISQLSKSCIVPVYGVWNFHMGYGIVGGKLISGFYQGGTAAKMALEILNGKQPSEIPIISERTNYFAFDYMMLERFGISIENLPQDSIIINQPSSTRKQILILNSYNKGLQWTDDVEAGIKAGLGSKLDKIDFTYEYMDIKKNSGPLYLQKLYELLKSKYSNKNLDGIITTDDDAFKFMLNCHNILLRNTPVVFCGINYLEDKAIEDKKYLTGVVEAYDLESTIDIALQLHPRVKNIIVINDTTLTGAANRKNVENIIPKYKDKVSFEFWEDVNMSFIQQNVKVLSDDYLILLMTFNRDKSNNSFSYDDSIKLVSEGCTVPIYSVWDFYMGKGLFGGMLASGFIQGQTAGEMLSQILDGKNPSDIQIDTTSTNLYMFDYNQMKRFGVNQANLPLGSRVINAPLSWESYYNQNRVMLVILASLIILLSILVLIIFLLRNNIEIRKKSEQESLLYATTDPLTGLYNRRFCMEYLGKLASKSPDNLNKFVICFFDINGLKKVNDTLGHLQGDDLILTVSKLIKSKIREDDVLCRIGGDEFLLIFPRTALEIATSIWSRIEKKLDNYNQTLTKPYTISISAGFAEHDSESKLVTIDELIEIADNEMYKNKANKKMLHHPQ